MSRRLKAVALECDHSYLRAAGNVLRRHRSGKLNETQCVATLARLKANALRKLGEDGGFYAR